MHGCGVRTPSAAAVAAATWGLAILMHIPKVGMFDIGAKSMIVAAGMPAAVTVGALVATRLAGAAPIVHDIMAPLTTCWPIVLPRLSSCRARNRRRSRRRTPRLLLLAAAREGARAAEPLGGGRGLRRVSAGRRTHRPKLAAPAAERATPPATVARPLPGGGGARRAP
jgi:hypothetical protein